MDNRHDDATANTVDLTILFDKLSDHYWSNFDEVSRANNDLNIEDDHALAVIFRKMSDYYLDGMGSANNPGAGDLWLIYDSLAEAFGLYDEPKEEADAVPTTIDELTKLLNRLEEYEMGNKKLIATKSISEMFQDLSDLYQEDAEEAQDAGFDDDEDLPVTVGEL